MLRVSLDVLLMLSTFILLSPAYCREPKGQSYNSQLLHPTGQNGQKQ